MCVDGRGVVLGRVFFLNPELVVPIEPGQLEKIMRWDTAEIGCAAQIVKHTSTACDRPENEKQT